MQVKPIVGTGEHTWGRNKRRLISIKNTLSSSAMTAHDQALIEILEGRAYYQEAETYHVIQIGGTGAF